MAKPKKRSRRREPVELDPGWTWPPNPPWGPQPPPWPYQRDLTPDGRYTHPHPTPTYLTPKPVPQDDVAVAENLQSRIASASKILAEVMTDAERAGLIVVWDPIVRHEDQGGF